MDSGFGDDEAYNVYDKPWRQDHSIGSNIYRPSKNADKDLYGDDLDNLMKTNRSDDICGLWWRYSIPKLLVFRVIRVK